MNQQENNLGQQQKVETVWEAALKIYPFPFTPERIAFIAGANWQQSQSIEPMVDKVLEYIIRNVKVTDEHIDGDGDYHGKQIQARSLLSLKPQLLKLLKDGKE